MKSTKEKASGLTMFGKALVKKVAYSLKNSFAFKKKAVANAYAESTNGYSPSGHKTTIDSIGSGPKPLPLIGKLSWQGQYRVAISAVVVTLALSAGLGFIANSLTARLNGLRQNVQLISQVILRLQGEVKSASSGNSDSFINADKSIIEGLTKVSEVSEYADLTEIQRLPLPPVTIHSNWNDTLWNVIAKPSINETEVIAKVLDLLDAYGAILNREPQFANFSNASQQMYQSTLDADIAYEGALKLGVKENSLLVSLDLLKSISKEFIASGGVTFDYELFNATRSKALAQVNTLLHEQKDPGGKAATLLAEVATKIGTDIGIDSMSLTLLASSVRNSSENITNNLPVLMGEITKETGLVTKALNQAVTTPSPLVGLWSVSAFLLALAALELSTLLLINSKQSAFAAYTARKEQLSADEDVRRAIDELDPISEGDLTARLTIMDNTLTTVADRVNVTMENMQDAMIEVKSTTRTVEGTIERIFEYAEDSREITDMASDQAQASRRASEEGVRAVDIVADRTMRQRSSMQEVSKRVKHLGEVTQSITSVVELIEAIASKTEVLAINTSLRAADAGSEGAAFFVISSEIKGLTTDIKRRLNDIVLSVKAVQTETQSVIANVESVTAELVDSGRYMDEARTALGKINKVAQELDALMQRVRKSSETQTEAASNAVMVMGKLSESTSRFKTSLNGA